MSERKLIAAGTHFEKIFGYSRAVRVGPIVTVAGCTASAPEGPVGGSDIVAQTAECLQRIKGALEEAGASLQDVVRTRFYVTDISELEAIGRVHLEFFAGILPASTIVQVSALAHPSLLVEVEADAFLEN
ncbi:RidA family protein [Streptomyces sp. NBC_01142]|uniref:RidA family protein n=1 Tax=Streptomyces sp. NBC_01142 TaxID=2975865 RepID=UPI00224E997E|nr:RidA family protein [Streptomyces sp. NBC_01142]MCX4820190.1 RidA family protein [Streptomyces sp. NBC_01142]